MKVLDFLYYRLYRAFLKTSAKDVSEYVTCLWLTLLFLFNAIVICKKLGFMIPNPAKYAYPKVYALFLCAPLILILYFIFVYKKRYLYLIERYKDETKQQRIRGNLILIAYAVATFAALILL